MKFIETKHPSCYDVTIEEQSNFLQPCTAKNPDKKICPFPENEDFFLK